MDDTLGFNEAFGPFKEVVSHARGGLGEVYRATDSELNRVVAIKGLQPRFLESSEMRRRFLMEAEVTARLEHPGIVPVYRMLDDKERGPAYVMRFIEGETLQDAITLFHSQRENQVEFRRLLQAFLQICQTIAYAHSRGVIHRDLKPQNVMLGRFGEALVVDWGLAKVVGRAATQPDPSSTAEETLVPQSSGSETQLGSAVGTPAFMSPEQAAGRWDVIDHRTDVYGLGAVLYSILTGKKPFESDNWPETQQRIQRGQFKRPRELNGQISRSLEAICLHAMKQQPEDRYATVSELAEDVEHWLADEPVAACPEGALERAKRLIKRHRNSIGIFAVVMTIAVIGLAIGLFLLDQKNRQIVAQKTLTESAQRRSTALNRFLIDDVIRQADPENNPVGNRMTVRDLLDQASVSIESDKGMESTPETECEIRTVLGQVYQKLGDYTEAIKHFKRAWQLRTTIHTDSDLETLVARNDYVYAVVDRDLGNDALVLAQSAYDACKRTLGVSHPETARAQATLGAWHNANGDPRVAEKLLRESSAILHRELGANDRLSIDVDNSLAISLGTSDQLEEAEKVIASVVARRRLNPRDPELTLALGNHGFVLLILGRYKAAEQVALEALEIGIATQDPQSPNTLQARNLLGYAYECQERWEPAEKLLSEVLESRKSLPPSSTDYQRSLGFVARINAKQQKWDVSSKYLAEMMSGQHPEDYPQRDELAAALHQALVATTPSAEQTLLLEKCWTAVKVPLWQGDWLRAEVGYRHSRAAVLANATDLAKQQLAEASKAILDSVSPPAWSTREDRFTPPVAEIQ